MPRLAMLRLLAATSLACAVAPTSAAQFVLDTKPTFDETTRGGQVFFSIRAFSEDVTVCGLSVYLPPQLQLPPPTAFGSIGETVAFPRALRAYVGDASAQPDSFSGWTLLTTEQVTSAKQYVFLSFPSVTITAGTERQFSVYGQSIADQNIYYREVNFVDVIENLDLQIVSNVGSPDPASFNGNTVDAQFVGTVHYSLANGTCPGEDLPVEVLPPTLYDGPEPGGVGPLVAGKAYVVQAGTFGWAEVPAGKTLTAEPGTTVLFGDGTVHASRLNVKGTIDWTQTTVSSVYDDEAGGDTDGQLGLPPRAPEPGDFEGIDFRFNSDGSLWSGGSLRYAGSNASLAPLDVDDGGVSIDGVVFENNGPGIGFTLSADNSGELTVTDCVFLDNESPPIGRVTFDQLDGFEGILAGGNQGGDFITLSGSTAGCFGAPLAKITEKVEISDAYPAGLLMVDGSVCITDGGSLELGPGSALKFKVDRNGGIEVLSGGTLEINGTGALPVQLASLSNDSVLGDSESDGPSVGEAGDWAGIRYLPGSLGFVKHASISDAGDLRPGLDVQSSNVSVDAVRVENIANDGLRVSSLAGDVTNSIAAGCARDGFVLPSSDPDGTAPSLVGSTTIDNGRDGVRTISGTLGGEIRNSIAWNNAGENFGAGIDDTRVFSSLGDFDGVNGNLLADPLLDSEGAPGAGSPAVDAGSPSLVATVSDFADSSRLGGDGLFPLPDMGAIELTGIELGGQPIVIGGTTSLQTLAPGDPGAPVVYLAGPPLEVFLPGFGLLAIDLTSYVPLGAGTEGEDFQFTTPGKESGGASLIGQTFAIQGFVLTGAPGSFEVTNAFVSQTQELSPLIVQ